MKNDSIIISDKVKPTTTTVSNHFIDTYMAKANGEYIKVYLMLSRILQSSEKISVSILANRLDMTERAVLRALQYWEQEDLISLEKPSSQTIPVTAAREGASATDSDTPSKASLSPMQLKEKESDQEFCHLKYVTEMYIGHPMTGPEINSLIYIYDTLQMPMDLVEFLVEYCVNNHKASLRYMEKVAIDWHKRDIRTLAQAKSQAASFGKEYYQIMNALGLKNHPAPSQIETMDQWLYKDGHSISLVLEACKRTIDTIATPSFPYVSKILDTWKKAGITSVKQINDSKPPQSSSKKPKSNRQPYSNSKNKPNFEQRNYDFDALTQKYIKKINQ